MFRIRLLLLFLFFAKLIFAQEIYINAQGGTIYKFNPSNCNLRVLCTINYSETFTDIGFHPDGNIYQITTNGELHLIDTLNATSTVVHTFPQGVMYTSLVFDANGNALVADRDIGYLYQYNLINNTETLLGTLPEGAAGDLTYNSGKLIYVSDNYHFWEINLSDFSRSTLLYTEDRTFRVFSVFSLSNYCGNKTETFYDKGSSIYKLDIENGTSQYVCDLNFRVYGGASQFEFLAQNPVKLILKQKENLTCTNLGRIELSANGGEPPYLFSIDGTNFQPDSTFVNINANSYLLYVRDAKGCEDTISTQILNESSVQVQVQKFNTTCGETNGIIRIQATSPLPLQYSISSGLSFSDTTLYRQLSAGNYTVVVTNGIDCTITQSVTIHSSISAPAILSIVQQDSSCTLPNILINATGGNGQLTYCVGVSTCNNSGTFTNTQAGEYIFTVSDSLGCLTDSVFTVLNYSPVKISEVKANSTACKQNFGSIIVDAQGGKEPISYYLNGVNHFQHQAFNNLERGIYTIEVKDDRNCIDSAKVSILDSCDIYVPNVFTPNYDGRNDVFTFYSGANNLFIHNFSIYNRWGEKIYECNDFAYDANSMNCFWDGYFKNKKQIPQVFVYMLDYTLNGIRNHKKGNFTLMN